MENLGLIVLRANGDDIFFMLFFICVVVVLAYGIGCLGRKRKIGFGWAFAISLFLNPLIGHRLSTQRLATFYSGRFPSTRLRTVHTGLPVHGSPPSHSV